jgi:hypothetical protein
MSLRSFFLFEDRLPAGARPVYLPAGDRAIYVRTGSVNVVGDTSSQFLWEHCATTAGEELTLVADSQALVLWRWELADDADPDPERFQFRSAPEASSELKLAMTCDLDDRYTWLMRCDTVSFPPGGVALTHLHQGPGIRIVHSGEITIETEGASSTYRSGQAWAEKGVLPVYAPTTEDTSTMFIRCFLLPKQNKGASSIRIVRPEDRSKPNTQSYRILSERVMARTIGPVKL